MEEGQGVVVGVSSFGRPIVVAEGDLSATRYYFVVLTVLLSLCALLHVVRRFLQLSTKMQLSQASWQEKKLYWWGLLVAFTVYLIIHGAHYADNIARPVAYFEPMWLYRGYLLSTMEITFFFNWPATIGGALAVGALFSTVPSEFFAATLQRQKRLCWGIVAYSATALLTLMHYSIEPPTSYSWEVNVTIAGEGVAGGILALAALMLKCMVTRHYQSLEGRCPNESELGDLSSDGEARDKDAGTQLPSTTHIRRRSRDSSVSNE